MKGKQYIGSHIRETSKKKTLSDDRKQANDFYTALTALVKFSLTKPCLDVREFNRNCQISIRNHNSLYRWKHVRQSAVVDLKGSAQPPTDVCHILSFGSCLFYFCWREISRAALQDMLRC